MRSDTHNRNRRAGALSLAAVLLAAGLVVRATSGPAAWIMFAGDPQHTAVSAVGAQPLETIRWSTPVDLAPPTGTILIHYGSPLATPSNTIIVPVKTGSTGGFRVDARNGQNGALIWSQNTDYILPQHNWTPSGRPGLLAGTTRRPSFPPRWCPRTRAARRICSSPSTTTTPVWTAGLA